MSSLGDFLITGERGRLRVGEAGWGKRQAGARQQGRRRGWAWLWRVEDESSPTSCAVGWGEALVYRSKELFP